MATNIETEEEISKSSSNENDPIREAKQLAENLNQPIASVKTCLFEMLYLSDFARKQITLHNI